MTTKRRKANDAPPPRETWRPDAACPDCGLAPPVRFSEMEVRRARRERQGAHVQSVQCPRCRSRYWLTAADIANATLDGAKPAA